jgi:nanoRNase/pAp phosphatase (c-di-AMP/oligoRNAs hydrolase)
MGIIKNGQDFEGNDGRARRLADLLSSKSGEAGIFTHENPDPDAIASAAGIARLCREFDLKPRIFFNPQPVDDQGALMVTVLGLASEMPDEGSMEDLVSNLSATILVDSGVPGENNQLPEEFTPTAVIDHHSTSVIFRDAEFTDIRPNIGATSTMVAQYFQSLEIDPSPELASALMFGMRIDTKDFTRHLSPEDLGAAGFLLPFTDAALMDELTQVRYDAKTMDVMGRAIANRDMRMGYVLSCLDFIEKHRVLYAAAEFLFKQEDAKTVVVYGILDGVVHFSARSRDQDVNLGELLKKAFGAKGTAGGHPNSAGAQVPLELIANIDESDKYVLVDTLRAEVARDFFSAVGLDDVA